MKNFKRFIAALMATVIVATLSGISAFATKAYPGVEDASNLGVTSYLCFGDSIATGYLSEQSGEDFRKINIAQTLRDGETTTNAYPTMIADALGLDVKDNPFGYFGNGNTQKNNEAWSWKQSKYAFYNYARDGLTSHEFRLLLDPSYYNQMTEEERNISDNIILGGDFTKRGMGGFKTMQKHIHYDLKQADVITAWFGSNDLLFYVLQTTLSIVNDQSITAAVNGALAAFGIGGALDALVNTAVLVGKLPLVLATMVTQSSKANAAFAENWDAFMGMVLAEKKPNAKIYVGDIYNSNAGLKFTSTSQFRVGQLLGFSTNEINNVIRNTSKYRSQYTVVHTSG
ncbi:MAG: SGNH/GDSL hydrolase family protein, partial [Acutalibacteraceae bacterium]|nr:SGNH/GDSL hydrolase family protein [Acutalibacteraceae bacterium]